MRWKVQWTLPSVCMTFDIGQCTKCGEIVSIALTSEDRRKHLGSLSHYDLKGGSRCCWGQSKQSKMEGFPCIPRIQPWYNMQQYHTKLTRMSFEGSFDLNAERCVCVSVLFSNTIHAYTT